MDQLSVRQLPTPAVRRQLLAWLICSSLAAVVFAILAWSYARAGNKLGYGLFLVAFAYAYAGASTVALRLRKWRRRR